MEASATVVYIRYLTDDGTTTGNKNLAIDGSATSTNFFVSCPDGKTLYLERLIFEILDTKTPEAEDYGDTGSSLSAGIQFKILSAGTEELAALNPEPLRTNSDWSQLCYDVTPSNFTNTTNASIHGRWTFSNSFGKPLMIKQGQRLNVAVKDDLSGLLTHTLQVQGIVI